MTFEDCKVYTIRGIEMIHIAEFAQLTGRSIQSTRHLVEDGNKVRKLKFFRDRYNSKSVSVVAYLMRK